MRSAFGSPLIVFALLGIYCISSVFTNSFLAVPRTINWKQTSPRLQKNTLNPLPKIAVNPHPLPSIPVPNERRPPLQMNGWLAGPRKFHLRPTIRPTMALLPWNPKLMALEGSSLHRENVAHGTVLPRNFHHRELRL